MKHTPGPWSVDVSSVYPGQEDRRVRAETGFAIAAVHLTNGDDFKLNVAEREANSHLIAASPELYSAAKEVIEHFFNPENTYEGLEALLIKLRSTVAKAEQGENDNE